MKKTFQSKYIFALFAIIVIACFISGLSSSSPDGLEFVANKLHLSANFSDSIIPVMSPFKDYQVSGINNPYLLNAFIGLVGVSACFAVTFFSLKVVSFLK